MAEIPLAGESVRQAEISLPIKLPSLGKLYGDKIPEGEIVIYPIRGQQEEMLASMGDNQNQAMFMLQHIVQQLVKLPVGMPIQDLLVTDWMALLLNILAFSYSSIVTVTPQCPSCKTQFRHEQDLKNLECTYACDLPGELQEPMKTEPLPRSKQVITFQMLRVRHMNEVQDYAQKYQAKQGTGGTDPSFTYSQALHILAIDGESVQTLDAMRWLRQALAYDLTILRQEFAKWATGYDMSALVHCPKCGLSFAAGLPLDFFRQVRSAP